ncbi:OLC1v1028823C1 [Oldenlandia corymbosa var. corymbosa]|uniref:OLC1v1028823C1 n=1 Tax=Oldenlandia corymbosa var. corymbosa TaxID=529605 RepID=A0AAV1CFC7_OLDCO|nr:OLC1v1028823C1 [Oldenlandia corymbosa var. corymbosa]
MVLASALLEILRRPTSGFDVMMELMMFAVPLWIAVVIGVLVGWSWKPRWAAAHFDAKDDQHRNNHSNSETTLFQQFSDSIPSFSSLKFQLPAFNFAGGVSDSSSDKVDSGSPSSSSNVESSSLLDERDLKHIRRLTEETDGGPVWIQMMNRSTNNMSYQAWRRDPETGPPQYRSRTVYENATPEIVRDFFWDDEFRLKWDDMLLHAETLEESSATGTMVVQWVRKFPFFCSDREYIIGRRIWKSGDAYYCVTKGVPYAAVPRRQKPRRVDLYYSSWCIRPVESSKDGRLTACEVLLFHHEDMGIPWEIAKLGVRQGMWGAVKKIDPGLRAYQNYRSSGATLSPSAVMAQVNTKVSPDYLKLLESSSDDAASSEIDGTLSPPEKPSFRGNIPRYLVVGGAVALACTLDHGLLTKAVIFGVARRFANMGKQRL